MSWNWLYLIWGLASNVTLGLDDAGAEFGVIDVCDGFAIRLGGALNTFGDCWWTNFEVGALGGNEARTLGGIRTPKNISNSI